MGSPQRLFVDVNETTVGILLCRGPASYEFFVPACAVTPQNRIDVVSLGFNCEFGFAQRYVGAEPMSLFRWSLGVVPGYFAIKYLSAPTN